MNAARGLTATAIATALVLPLSASAIADSDTVQSVGSHEMVSMRADGSHTESPSDWATISGNGRFVAFRSSDDYLVAGETITGSTQLYLRDLRTGATRLVTRGHGGRPGAGPTYGFASLSWDGSRTVYSSWANNLVREDANGYSDVFMLDTKTGVTTLLSYTTAGGSANDSSGTPSISADGRWVVFESAADDLVPGVDGPGLDVFLIDTATRAISVVSQAPDGEVAEGDSTQPVIAADGRAVAFTSTATNMVDDDENVYPDVFVRDLTTGEVTLVSRSSTGQQGNRGSEWPALSPDGQFVTFVTQSYNFGFDDDTYTHDTFVRDRARGTTSMASVALDGSGGAGSWLRSPVCADGTTYFTAPADDLVEGDDNGHYDIFVNPPGDRPMSKITFDREGGGTSGTSLRPSVSGSCKRVVYDSYATDIVDDPFGDFDVFVYRSR